jgi:hydrogenase nickel incorporation protein HypB
MHRVKVRVVEDALDANNTIARANRADFDAPRRDRRQPHERARARARRRCSRRCSPRASTASASACSRATCRGRWTPTGSRACTSRSTQLNTDRASAASATSTPTWCAPRCPRCRCDDIDLLIIENVGNLVCPAEFRVGEDARVMVSSVTEGEDKPLKYPLMFRTCDLVLVNKLDLMPHLDVDLERFLHNLDAVHPDVERMLVSARTGEGDRRLAHVAAELVAARVGGAPCDRRGLAGPPWRVERGWPSAGGQARYRRGVRLARLCHRMAERFARGGRLVAIGLAAPARSDARHVAVEFVHPVIVGKRALPALGLTGESGRWPPSSGSSPSPTTS